MSTINDGTKPGPYNEHGTGQVDSATLKLIGFWFANPSAWFNIMERQFEDVAVLIENQRYLRFLDAMNQDTIDKCIDLIPFWNLCIQSPPVQGRVILASSSESFYNMFNVFNVAYCRSSKQAFQVKFQSSISTPFTF